ncbi:DedA family protein [Gluconacetobacter takamatsuzukensis]|uniref:DedA family protein n=2 Tax=Gluconacetobacter takamatsuzukensis TaxID=1286190 RepID=A0A7W4KC10_9PROT|nr:DedA family protein [Gluconacetobacter takamatsuzukensis]MBB2204166.1 DedA family protein [Gluconacetobacter takamatsuzukensis]
MDGSGPLLHSFESLFVHYGYGVIAVVVMLESMGLPLPAETLIISSALYCAATHRLDISWVAVAAIVGAIMGDNFGYLIGRTFGHRLLERHGGKVGLNDSRLMLGRYLFRRHGGKVVFFGRFIAVLRVFVALLAGANRMPWHTFLFFNALGGIGWAGGYAVGAYYLGHKVLSLSGPVGITLGIVAAVVLGGSFLFLKKNEVRLTAEATRAAEREQQGESAP